MKKHLSLLRQPFWWIFAAVLIWDIGLLSPLCFSLDWQNTWGWARNIQTNGLGMVYAGKPLYNYPPLMAYMLAAFAHGFTSAEALRQNLYWTKLIPLVFDFVAAAMVVKWAGDRRREVIYLLLLIANPIYIFNSYTWGQIDSTYCVLVFLALFAMAHDRPVAAALLYTLAFNFKIQALLFAPLFGLILLWKFKDPWPIKQILTALGTAIGLQFIILLPFLFAGQLGQMFAILKNPVNYYRAVSLNAFNFWQFVYGLKSINTDDSVKILGGFTAQQIGLGLFFGFSLVVLGPVLARIVQSKRVSQPLTWKEENLLLMCGLIPLGFFFFCTQMHERYSQSAILFLAVYSFRTRRYWVLALMFLAYGLNVEYVFQYYQLRDFWQYFFDSRLVAAIYAALIGLLLWRYFKSLPKYSEASPHG